MTVRIRSITIDCADHYRLAEFWSQATGWQEDPDNPNQPDDPESLLISPDRQLCLLFIPVPEGKRDELRTDRSALTCGNMEPDRLLPGRALRRSPPGGAVVTRGGSHPT